MTNYYKTNKTKESEDDGLESFYAAAVEENHNLSNPMDSVKSLEPYRINNNSPVDTAKENNDDGLESFYTTNNYANNNLMYLADSVPSLRQNHVKNNRSANTISEMSSTVSSNIL